MEGLTEGRVVHFVMPNAAHRPAIVVNAWSNIGEYVEPGKVNLQVFTDGSNDVLQVSSEESTSFNDAVRSGLLWRTSIPYSTEPLPNTWHWIERA